jgi:hypothetical protein
MSFLWQPAAPIEMQLETSRPKLFIWAGRKHRIRKIAREWRIDIGWWRFRLWRDYYKVLTDSNLLVLIYQDLQDESWFLLQVYD